MNEKNQKSGVFSLPQNRDEAKKTILELCAQYYDRFLKDDAPFVPGDRISYAGRVFDEEELYSLVDSSLDFWLTAGAYAAKFEREFAAWLGVAHCALVNSGSSAVLLALAALTAEELQAQNSQAPAIGASARSAPARSQAADGRRARQFPV